MWREREREGGLVPSFRESTCVLNIIIMVRYALGNFLRNIFFLKILVIGVANDQHNVFLFSSTFKINSLPRKLLFRNLSSIQILITKSIITMLIYISYAYFYVTYPYIYTCINNCTILYHIIDNHIIIFPMLQSLTNVSFYGKKMIVLIKNF